MSALTKWRVRSPEEALIYLTDCTLATVADMAWKKKRPKHEYQRQKNLAQTGCDWIKQFGLEKEARSTRVHDILSWKISVDDWAVKHEPGWKIQVSGIGGWADLKSTFDDGKTYGDDFYPTKKEAEEEAQAMRRDLTDFECRVVPSDQEAEFDLYD